MVRTAYRFRVFISYAHADRPLVEAMVDILDSMGFHALWDKDINPGKPFTQEIKDLIARAHLFIPLVTPNSSHRPWVHQETGFAMALNIPVLPISIGQIPGEMIAEVQAVTVKEDLSDLAQQLGQIDLLQLVTPKPNKPFSVIEIAEWPEQRHEYMARYANWVIELGEYGLFRAQARFTIFSVPDDDVDAPIWEQREGNAKRSHFVRHLQQEERRVMERHARMAGCRLIIDPTAPTFQEQGSEAHQARVSLLLKFLKSMPKDKLAVVISPRAQDANLAIVGDYFTAESAAGRPGGYVHTVFNAHPPTVLQRIQRFDQLFTELQTQNETSVDDVIAQVERCLRA